MNGSVLVTGGAGFIGLPLVSRLVQAGYDVYALTRPSPHPPDPTGLPALVWDLAREKAPRGPLPRCDAVVHLAARIPAPHARAGRVRDGDGDFSDNLAMVTNLLVHVGTPGHIVFASSVDVYGRPNAIPIKEDHPTEPLTAYGASKLVCERRLQKTAAAEGFVLTVLRLSQVYGPGDRTGKAIPRFIDALLDGRPPVIQGDGSDLRDYVHVDDVTRAIVLALERRQTGVFNIGTGRAYPIAEVVERLRRIHGSGPEPVYVERQGEKLNLQLDCSGAEAALGFAAQIPLGVGLRQQYEWARAVGTQGALKR